MEVFLRTFGCPSWFVRIVGMVFLTGFKVKFEVNFIFSQIYFFKT